MIMHRKKKKKKEIKKQCNRLFIKRRNGRQWKVYSVAKAILFDVSFIKIG
jgi:hypothetical protein